MTDALSLMRAYTSRRLSDPSLRPIHIQLTTNFTDDVLERVLGGMCVAEGYDPKIDRTAYRQYLFDLKKGGTNEADISYLFFDASPYKANEFSHSDTQMTELIRDIDAFCERTRGLVIVSAFILPYQNPYGASAETDPLFARLIGANDSLRALEKKHAHLHIFDTNIVAARIGHASVRDMRGMYAFDMPFRTDFLLALSDGWLSYVRALTGRSKKCIVLDLDNTLWGGVVGEDGATGVKLGAEYPGNAYQNFQRVLLSYLERGIILAIASKNNTEDVRELFEKNENMVLKEEHFAAIRTNWESKSDNIKSISQELNIGLDSIVFIDDSPVERASVRAELPDVLVPEFSLPPEGYVSALLSLNVFHQLALTDEDREKTKMYADERRRKNAASAATDLDAYMRSLDIRLEVARQEGVDIERAAQMSQKTNQWNLTTKRFTSDDMQTFVHSDLVWTGAMSDTFGSYGTVLLAIVTCKGAVATLDTFLMSCRVMGRNAERVFLREIARDLAQRGARELHAAFIPTAKNAPSRAFLDENGFTRVSEAEGVITYRADISAICATLGREDIPITVERGREVQSSS